MLNRTRHIHFIGIGGIGMSALAEIMHRQGFTVSGSDRSPNEQTERLQRLGIKVYPDHQADQVLGDFVVYSSAVHEDNPELAEARKRGLLCVKRAELLGELIRGKKSIAVAGTHGKTTTSAMTGMTLLHAGFDPTLFIGGVIREIESNTRMGNSDWVVVEADEYDRSFLRLHPYISVIHNMEADHLDCYQDLEDIRRSFIQFAEQTSVFGLVLVNVDNDGSRAVLGEVNRNILTYGCSPEADLRASGVRAENGNTEFEISFHDKPLGNIRLNLAGQHQVMNALACIGAAWAIGIPFTVIQSSLAKFQGTSRRFEILGKKNGATWIDDYAHHPTEIQATLKAAKERFPGQRIIAVFQPHLYSRTRDLLYQFASAFADADTVWLTGIYAAREAPPDSKDWNQILMKAIQSQHGSVRFVQDKFQLTGEMTPDILDGDVIITMGAGDITLIGREYLKQKDNA